MLGMPNPTAYDLKFRALGIPVRISPWFWLGTLMIGPHDDVRAMLIFIPVALISILVHEYGHGLMYRLFGTRSEIALFALGGLCAPEPRRHTTGQRLAVLAMGPGAQFLLLFLLMLLGNLALGIPWSNYPKYAGAMLGFETGPASGIRPRIDLPPEAMLNLLIAFDYAFWINWIWPLLNLLPLWPLDGGQMTHAVLTRVDPRDGARKTHIIGMVVGGLLAFYVLRQFVDSPGQQAGLLRVIFFAWFALMNYQMLQEYQRGYGSRHDDDDADWWRR